MLFSSSLNIVGAMLTTGLGVGGLVKPLMTARIIGIEPSEPRGISEIRATYGGLFLSLGGLALYFQDEKVYSTIGLAWIGAAIARVVSMTIDRQVNKLNFGGVILEGGIGLILLL